MFADDLTALNIGSKGDLCQFQEDISRIQNWCDVNNLYLNAKKCSIMPVRGIVDAQLVIKRQLNAMNKRVTYSILPVENYKERLLQLELLPTLYYQKLKELFTFYYYQQ